MWRIASFDVTKKSDTCQIIDTGLDAVRFWDSSRHSLLHCLADVIELKANIVFAAGGCEHRAKCTAFRGSTENTEIINSVRQLDWSLGWKKT